MASSLIAKRPREFPDYVCTSTIYTALCVPNRHDLQDWELRLGLQHVDSAFGPIFSRPFRFAYAILPDWECTYDSAMIPCEWYDTRIWLFWRTTPLLDLIVLAAFALFFFAVWHYSGGKFRW